MATDTEIMDQTVAADAMEALILRQPDSPNKVMQMEMISSTRKALQAQLAAVHGVVSASTASAAVDESTERLKASLLEDHRAAVVRGKGKGVVPAPSKKSQIKVAEPLATPKPVGVIRKAASSSGGKGFERMEVDDLKTVPKEQMQLAIKRTDPGLGKVPCDLCKTEWKWSMMLNEPKYDDEGGRYFERTCWVCLADILKISVEEAKGYVLSKGGYSGKKKARRDAFKDAVENVQQFFELSMAFRVDEDGNLCDGGPITGKVKRQIESIARKSMLKVFGNVQDLIRRRRELEFREAAEMEKQDELVKQLAKEKDPKVMAQLVKLIDDINNRPPVFLGFQDVEGITQEQKNNLWMTATYQDEFSNGGTGNYLCFYFVCQAAMGKGSAGRCLCTMASIDWKRKIETTKWVAGQAWYCLECWCRFKAGWGCLVEWEIDGQLYYQRSECPDAASLDIMAMKAERDVFKGGMSAEQLFAALPKYPPSRTTLVQPKSPSTHRMVDVPFFDSLPMLKWIQIMNMIPEV